VSESVLHEADDDAVTHEDGIYSDCSTGEIVNNTDRNLPRQFFVQVAWLGRVEFDAKPKRVWRADCNKINIIQQNIK